MSHRLLAAFPDAATAVSLSLIWQWPLAFGVESVSSAIVLTALELPALLALGGLFMFQMKSEWHEKFKGIAVFSTAAYCIGVVAVAVLNKLPSGWLLLAMLWMIAAKALVFVAARREGTWLIEAIRLGVQGGLFMVVLVIVDEPSTPLGRGGFTPGALQNLALPEIESELLRDGPFTLPWSFIPSGAVYFALCSIVRYAMTSRRPVG